MDPVRRRLRLRQLTTGRESTFWHTPRARRLAVCYRMSSCSVDMGEAA